MTSPTLFIIEPKYVYDVFFLKFLNFHGKCLSNDSICELLNTSEKSVDKYIYFILERYKDYMELFKIVDSDEINKIIKL